MDYVIIYNIGNYRTDWFIIDEKTAKRVVEIMDKWGSTISFDDKWITLRTFNVNSVKRLDNFNEIDKIWYSLSPNEKAYIQNCEMDIDPVSKIITKRWLKQWRKYIELLLSKFNKENGN